jgi:hypothetical protein
MVVGSHKVRFVKYLFIVFCDVQKSMNELSRTIERKLIFLCSKA